ncbi:hypothetical protein [Faecalibacter rhinopitheci]|uniref:Uncharacterized protein n=1 Tax=Faecalibacter rhinopitheci TaxID=2779678 RepID=A0A8J7FRD0_9FLAO|nr:hypothetical protein [Faecalibacter rhinopitheci]MBF0596127.1 hypothetical protein [Faecalibacter rhinopitheci]
MIKFALIILMTVGNALYAQDALKEARINLTKAVDDDKTCSLMINKLTNHQNATEMAYLGAYYAISAQHQFLPTNKLKNFNKGKKLIEAAVLKDPTLSEVRYLRLLIQSQSPKFLGFHKSIETDQNFLCQNYKNITNLDLKNKINNLLKKDCTI